MTVLYTASLYVKKDVEAKGFTILDTTVKSGLPIFAPTWDIVMKHKSSGKHLSDDKAYMSVYYQLMRESYAKHKEEWLDTITQQTVVLGCYCHAGAFCHRHLLVDMFVRIGAKIDHPITYLGEIIKGGTVKFFNHTYLP